MKGGKCGVNPLCHLRKVFKNPKLTNEKNIAELKKRCLNNQNAGDELINKYGIACYTSNVRNHGNVRNPGNVAIKSSGGGGDLFTINENEIESESAHDPLYNQHQTEINFRSPCEKQKAACDENCDKKMFFKYKCKKKCIDNSNTCYIINGGKSKPRSKSRSKTQSKPRSKSKSKPRLKIQSKRKIYTGSRGGKYYISKGRKVYV